MTLGILVLQAKESGQVKILGVYPPEFACPPKLLDNIGTNLDYGSFIPWGDVSTEEGIALCKLEETELGKEYLVCLVSDENVDLHSVEGFLNLVAPKLALAGNLGKLAENFPKLAPLVFENVQVLEVGTQKAKPVQAPVTHSPTVEVKICPFRMSLPNGLQDCIRERCMAYFDGLDQELPKKGCFLIHGNHFRLAGPGIE
jgi:hypothetical protein